jgi:RHS repeat-associated protein
MLSYGDAQYFYTPNGELRMKVEGTDTTRYTYDYFGNLITVILPNKDRIDYIIDGQNRRIGKKLNGQIVKKWIYSGQLTPVAELDSAGNIVARFAGNYMIKGGATYQFITDHLGSVRLVVDVATGTVMQRLDYDEYGNVSYDSNPDFTPFGFCGGLYDNQTKLTRFGARDYDAETGRWTAKDPIGFGGGVSNVYVYCLNDPINFIDPTGLKKRCYSNEEIAGAQAINAINYQSIKEGREYGGFIIKNKNGTYSYTEPIQLSESGGAIRRPINAVAIYHTHGRRTVGWNNENFSGSDIYVSVEVIKGNSYLGTPKGIIKMFNPKTWEVRNLPYPKKKEGEVPCDCL